MNAFDWGDGLDAAALAARMRDIVSRKAPPRGDSSGDAGAESIEQILADFLRDQDQFHASVAEALGLLAAEVAGMRQAMSALEERLKAEALLNFRGRRGPSADRSSEARAGQAGGRKEPRG